MIKVYVRAIVPTKGHYLLMGYKDQEGRDAWDLPGGLLKGGVDVKQFLQDTVRQTTGYTIHKLRFFEIVCRVRPRSRDADALTTLEFVFSCTVDSVASEAGTNPIDLLPFAQFEWLESDGRFKEDKVMALIGKFHRKSASLNETHLHTDNEKPTS